MNEAKLIAEVTVLTEMVRVLSDRIAQMDAEKTLQALHDENERLGLYEQEQGEPNIQSYPKKDSLPIKWSDYEYNGIHQKPVAWMDVDGNVSDNNDHKCFPIPLYTTTQQRTWVGLLDEEAQWLYDNCRTPSNLIDMTEAKLKEKNT